MTCATDIVPGTFEAMEPEQFRAIEMVHKIGEKIAEEHPELAEWYRDLNRSFIAWEVARELLPNECEVSEEVAATAVTYAISLLLPKAERDELTRLRRSEIMKAKWDFNSPEWREHCKNAARIRYSLGIRVDVKAMLDARGRTAWTDEEKEAVLRAAVDSKYRLPTGGPNYEQIARDVNDRFHGGKPIRYENSCRSLVGYTRKMAKKRAQQG